MGARKSREVRRALASDIQRARLDAGLSTRRLAKAAGISHSTLLALERDLYDPTTETVCRLAAALGMSMNVRLYPGSGPLIRDHLQAVMVGALTGILHKRWLPRPEVAVYRPVRGVIDLVLDDTTGTVCVACEAQSELRRLEQQVRWSTAKSDALAAGQDGEANPSREVGRLLLLRSTVRTRAVVSEYADFISLAYPARAADIYAALVGEAPWPGNGLLWCRVARGEAQILDRPPRGVRVGR